MLRITTAAMLTDLPDSAELFHTADGTAFVALMVDGHCETWPIRSAHFRTWLRHQYYKAAGSPPSAAAIGSALDLLEARAQFDAPRQDIYVRTAEHEGASTWTSPLSIGAPSRSPPMVEK